MQFIFADLSKSLLPDIVDSFNRSFADYFVKIVLTQSSLEEKIAAESIDLERSAGTFLNGKLAGFILTGIDGNISYNAGTGVLPEYRGNNLTEKMYGFLLPKLKLSGVHSQKLEVITKNEPAIKTYEKVGFRKVRTLACFKHNISNIKINQDIEIRQLEHLDESVAIQFWDSPPTWQNSLRASKQSTKPHKIAGAYSGQQLTGYIIYTTEGRVKQFAVRKDFRRRGIGRALFANAMSEIGDKEIVITNIDCEYPGTASFLEKLGLTNFLEQFEMEMNF